MYCTHNFYHCYFLCGTGVFLFEHMGHETFKNYSVTDCIRYTFHFSTLFYLVMQMKTSVQDNWDLSGNI